MAVDLKRLREDAGLRTQEIAAARFKASVRQWGAWERGEVEPPAPVVELLEIMARGAATQAVPVKVEGRVRAGAAAVQFGLDLGTVDVTPKVRNEPLFAVQVRGDSMTPEIKSGDKLVCRLIEDDDAPPNSIVIADLGESEYVVKRLRFPRGGRVLESIKDGIPLITGQFKIHAVVVEIRRSLERR